MKRKRNSKVISLFLAVIMILSSLPFAGISALAATADEEATPSLKLDIAATGKTVNVTVTALAASEIASGQFTLNYDSEKLELVFGAPVNRLDVFNPASMICVFCQEGGNAYAVDTVIFTAEFNVKAGPISVESITLAQVDNYTETYEQVNGVVAAFSCDHSVATEEVITEATREADGSKNVTCSVCGNVETDVVIHNFGEWKVTKEATTTEDGEEQRTCSVCGIIETRAIDKLTEPSLKLDIAATGETVNVTVTALAASKIAVGVFRLNYDSEKLEFVEGVTSSEDYVFNPASMMCVFCQEGGNAYAYDTVIFTAEFKVKATPIDANCVYFTDLDNITEDYVQVNEVVAPTFTCDHSTATEKVLTPADCLNAGEKEVSCAVCGALTTEEIPATGHSFEDFEAVKPTCTEDGIIAYKHCTKCDLNFSSDASEFEAEPLESITVKAEGHKFEACDAVEPTETEPGNIAYNYCTECGKNFPVDADIFADDSEAIADVTLPPVDIFSNEESGITVNANKGDLSEGTELVVSVKEKTNSSVTYDISLQSSGVEVQPTGNVSVKIPVPETMDGESVKVYHVEDDGTMTDMNAVYKDGFMVFTTEHFSEYKLAVPGTPGDVNDDGKINALDVLIVKRYIAKYDDAKLEGDQFALADVSGDGKVNAKDALAIMQKIAKLIDNFDEIK